MLLDQRRARNAASGAEIAALVDRARNWPGGIFEKDVTRALRLGSAAVGERRKGELRALAHQREPHVDHLDRLVGRMVRVALVVERIECLPDPGARAGDELLARDRDRQRKFLADIAEVEMRLPLGARRMAQAR